MTASPARRATLAAVFGGFLLTLVLAGCASLTPEQSARLSEAQQFADEVTTKYGARRVRVIADNSGSEGYTGYREQSDWITIRPADLERGSVRLMMVRPLAAATISRPPGTANAEEQRSRRYAENHRGVEIMVTFLGMPTRQAVDHYARILVWQSRRFDVETLYSVVRPCDELRDLWSRYAIAESVPACGFRKGP